MAQNNQITFVVPNVDAGKAFMKDVINAYEELGYLSVDDIYTYMNGTKDYTTDAEAIKRNKEYIWSVAQLQNNGYKVVPNPGFNNALIIIDTSDYMLDILSNSQDMVNHPKHYMSKSGIEVIDVIQAFTENLSGIEATDTGNIIKYACRWKTKNGIEDLKKLVWYANHLISHLKGDKK